MLNSLSFQGKNMARSLKLLEGLPMELQEAILEEIRIKQDLDRHEQRKRN